MSVKRFRLTKAAKFLIFIFIVALIGSGAYYGIETGYIKTDKKIEKNTAQTNVVEKEVSSNEPGTSEKVEVMTTESVEKEQNDIQKPLPVSKEKQNDNEINISLDEWIGWKSIIDANGGLKTSPDSIYGKMGLAVNINIINDATQSSNALIKGDLNAAGYTINRTAFLSKKFTDSGIKFVMPYITNYSNGGDGIIASENYKTIDSLVNAKIGVPQFSEAHSLVVWFINQSDLSEEDKQKIINGLVFFETPDEAAKAFFAGQIDVAATWQPYLSQAQSTSNCHVLFSTASSTRLVMDGILFREDWANSHADLVQKFIDGSLQARDMYTTEFSYIRAAMPMFSGMSDTEISDSAADADLTTWANNKQVLSEEAPAIFSDMCQVWKSIGEEINEEFGITLFDSKYNEALAEKYESIVPEDNAKNIVVTEENKQDIIDAEALLTKSTTVNFVINTAKFTDTAEASVALNEFIEVAKLLDGTIIQIEGNTDPNPESDPEDVANKMLSQQRAETVKKYFIMNGISADRIITIGNGSSKPMYANDTEENRALNRRTDVSFKCIE